MVEVIVESHLSAVTFSCVLGISAAARAGLNVCDAISQRLPSRKRYSITDVRGRGSYGVVLAGRTDEDAGVVAKLVNLSSATGMNVLGEPWFVTDIKSFRREIVMLHAVALGAPGIFPEILDACVVKGGAGVSFGFVLMRDVGTESLHAVLASGRVGARRLMQVCAQLLKSLHASGFVHGDLHTGNAICEPPHVQFVDTSRTVYFGDASVDCKVAKLYDLTVLINSVDDIARLDSMLLCSQFLQEYYGSSSAGVAEVNDLLCTPEQMREKREEFVRILEKTSL
ncbi:hypothetical protein JKP88DRAFT_253128 [Tribonema minus]|uniref:Protein kinase domain-containing protein n=1 Tax=Tribonema minus TaxID=303371 RepID=A0A836CJZ6_9STRA|nr:hypothetical protein JKP88DRAFT_253128 [Tribonema minus]